MDTVTPEQKAQQLVDKFYDLQIEIHGDIFVGITKLSKKCALLAVDEIINSFSVDKTIYDALKYWKRVGECLI